MKKAIKVVLAFLLSVIMLFSASCSAEERAYLNEDLDKSHYTPAQFAQWMYNRTQTSIKIKRPSDEIVYNIKMLMEDYESTGDYIDSLESIAIASSPKSEHINNYSLLANVLVEHAKRTNKDEIWTGVSWRDTGSALSMSMGGETMSVVAKQIMARGVDIRTLPMYKEVLREQVQSGEEIVALVYEGKDEGNSLVKVKYTENGQELYKEILLKDKQENETVVQVLQYSSVPDTTKDTVRVKFTDSAQAIEIAKKFVDNALYTRPQTSLGSLYVLRVMYEFATYIGYTDCKVIIDNPGQDDSSGEGDGKPEGTFSQVPLYTQYQTEYLAYVN